MIKVYLTKGEKRSFRREAKAMGLTMSALAAHKFINNANRELVVGTGNTKRTEPFAFSVKPNLRGRIEFAALQNDATLAGYVRELIVNN